MHPGGACDAYRWQENPEYRLRMERKEVCKMAKLLLKRFADETKQKSYWHRLSFSAMPRVAVTFEITGVAQIHPVIINIFK